MKATDQQKKVSQKERVGLMICEQCGSYAHDSDYMCLDCGYPLFPSTVPEASADPAQPTASESGKGATSELKPSSVNISDSNPQLGLGACPECGQRSLFWNRHDCVYRCVNPECKRAFTLEEYREKEARRLFEEQQTEQVLSSEPITEAADKIEPGAAEQVPSNELPVEATDKIKPGATEQVPSNEFATVATDKIESNATKQMPSNVSTAEVKDKTARGRIEEIPYNVLKTETRDKVEDGAKSAKKVNRNLALLIISVLAIGIVVLGVFLFLNSNDVGELSAQLNKSTQALAELQTQLAAHQEDIEGLTTQVTQTQQEIEALQAEMNLSKPLTPGEQLVYSGEVLAGNSVSFPIELKQFEEVRGKITGGISGLAFSIQDSGGSIIKDFGIILSSSFIFKAQTSGSYNIVIQGAGEFPAKYNLEYTLYLRQ